MKYHVHLPTYLTTSPCSFPTNRFPSSDSCTLYPAPKPEAENPLSTIHATNPSNPKIRSLPRRKSRCALVRGTSGL